MLWVKRKPRQFFAKPNLHQVIAGKLLVGQSIPGFLIHR